MSITCVNPLIESQSTYIIGILVYVPEGTQTFFLRCPPGGSSNPTIKAMEIQSHLVRDHSTHQRMPCIGSDNFCICESSI